MQIILGSSSPRRQELLGNAGFDFTILKPDTEELVIKGESPSKMVRRLSLEKAHAIFARVENAMQDFLIIAADTTVVSPSGKEVLNKPVDETDAFRILKKIQGKRHTVLTGYCLMGRRGKHVKIHRRAIKTLVDIRPLSSAEIRSYIATGEPMDKAGAYGAQGIGMGIIASIRGSYTNVVGLPITELIEDIQREFKWVPSWKKS